MTNEPYLIIHKVRGEAAFDVAIKMACPECLGDTFAPLKDGKYGGGCAECDGLGYWWIIPTSGHRAYPYWNEKTLHSILGEEMSWITGSMPPTLPDHYRHGPAPKIDIRALFKKSDWVPNPEAFIKRRL